MAIWQIIALQNFKEQSLLSILIIGIKKFVLNAVKYDCLFLLHKVAVAVQGNHIHPSRNHHKSRHLVPNPYIHSSDSKLINCPPLSCPANVSLPSMEQVVKVRVPCLKYVLG